MREKIRRILAGENVAAEHVRGILSADRNGSQRAQLDSIRAVRDRRVTPRTMNFAEHVLRIPEPEYHALRKVFPALDSTNSAEHREAWERFLASDLAHDYRVARTPNQVQRVTAAEQGRR